MNVRGNIYEFIETYINYKNKQFKILEKKHEEEKEKNTNENISQQPIHRLFQRRKSNEILWDFDAVSLHPSAMWEEKSIYQRIETGYGFTEDVNDELVEKFNNWIFNQGSAILKIKSYNVKNSIVQHLSVKKKMNKNEVKWLKLCYKIDNLTFVDIQEVLKTEGKLLEIFEGDINRGKCKVNPFR